MLKGTILIGNHNLSDLRNVPITPTPLDETFYLLYIFILKWNIMKNLNEEVNKIKHLFNYKKGDVKKVLNEGTTMSGCEDCIKDALGEYFEDLYNDVRDILSSEGFSDKEILEKISSLISSNLPHSSTPDFNDISVMSIGIEDTILDCRTDCEEIGGVVRPSGYENISDIKPDDL